MQTCALVHKNPKRKRNNKKNDSNAINKIRCTCSNQNCCIDKVSEAIEIPSTHNPKTL